ncbi:hypothetical protein GPJ56_002703 [Histomonas meleagridis]|nr:hypothetical protein GPJ56_002703 [Histomonas meleagridis]
MDSLVKPRSQSFQKNRFVVSRHSIDPAGVQAQPPKLPSSEIRNPIPSRTRKVFTISVQPKGCESVNPTESYLYGNSSSGEDPSILSLKNPMPRAKKQFKITRTNRESTDLWELVDFPQRNSTGNSSSNGNINKPPTIPQSRSDYDPLIDIF